MSLQICSLGSKIESKELGGKKMAKEYESLGLDWAPSYMDKYLSIFPVEKIWEWVLILQDVSTGDCRLPIPQARYVAKDQVNGQHCLGRSSAARFSAIRIFDRRFL